MTTDLDTRIRYVVADHVRRAPDVDIDQLLETGARRASRRRRRRGALTAVAVVGLSVLGVVGVVGLVDRDDPTIVVAGDDGDARTDIGRSASTTVAWPQDWELTLTLHDSRPARLVVDDGPCVQIERDRPYCQPDADWRLDWFVVPTEDSGFDLVVLQFLHEAPVITTDTGEEIPFDAELGPGALHRALVEIPTRPGYTIDSAERPVTVAFDGGIIDSAELFAAAGGQLCIELTAPNASTVDCVGLDADERGLTVNRSELNGQSILYGTAPPRTAMISIEDANGSRTGGVLADLGSRTVWLSDAAVSLDRTIDIEAVEFVDDGAGDPLPHTLASTTFDLTNPGPASIGPTTATSGR